MRRLLLALMALSAPTALAHDEKGNCPGESAAQATPAGPRLAKGELLRRGAPLPRDGKAVPLATVLATPTDGQVVLVEGVIRSACQQKGCWMELAPAGGGDGVRVTFKDYGFFVPTDAAGAQARVAGTLKVAVPEGAQAKDGREVQLVATGLELRRP